MSPIDAADVAANIVIDTVDVIDTPRETATPC